MSCVCVCVCQHWQVERRERKVLIAPHHIGFECRRTTTDRITAHGHPWTNCSNSCHSIALSKSRFAKSHATPPAIHGLLWLWAISHSLWTSISVSSVILYVYASSTHIWIWVWISSHNATVFNAHTATRTTKNLTQCKWCIDPGQTGRKCKRPSNLWTKGLW